MHEPAERLLEHTLTTSDRRVTGQLDLLLLGVQPAIVDHKTGPVLSEGLPDERYERQPSIYAWLAAETLNVDISDAALFSLRDGIVPIDVSRPVREPIVENALTALAEYNACAPPPQPAAPTSAACSTCPYVGACDAAWEALADGRVDGLGWGQAIRGVISAPVFLAKSDVGALRLDVVDGTVAGEVMLIDIPARRVERSEVGDRVAAWGLATRSEQPWTLAWQAGSSSLQASSRHAA